MSSAFVKTQARDPGARRQTCAGLDDRYELDCPWFDPDWLYAHPEFPLAASVAEQHSDEEDR